MIAPAARLLADLRRSVPAAALSLSVAVAGLLPAPARADNEDLRRALAALAAIGIIAYAVNESNDRESERRPVCTPQPPRPHRPVIEPPRPPRPNAGFLPVECVRDNATPPRDFGTRYDRRVVAQPCLRRSNVRIDTLPQQCRGTAYLRGRERPAFGFSCLRQAGYRFR